jgi:hypothetical protein
MGGNKYLVKKKPKIIKKKKIMKEIESSNEDLIEDLSNDDLSNDECKEDNTKYIINKIPSNKEDNDKKENARVITKSIEILTTIDPKQELSKEELLDKLQKMVNDTADLILIETVGYLISQLETLEEKLEELEKFRTTQQVQLTLKKIDKNVFDAKIKLDSDDKPDPDECEQIYTQSKQIYNEQKQYKKCPKAEIQKFKTKIAPKKLNVKIKALDYRL